MISSVNSINSNLGIVPSLDSKELTETSIDSATDLYQELDSRNIRVKRFIRDDYGVVVSKVDGEFLSDSLVRCSSVFMNFKCVTGKNSTVEGCGAVKHEFYRCNNRLCPRCSDVIGSRFMRKYRSFVEGMVNPKFMTLTLRNVDSIDRDYFSQLSRYWSAFKKRLFRDNYVLNKGLYVKEVTEKGSGFHVHLHVIYEGSYLPQKYISDQWSKVTTGSMVVDIRPVRHKFKDMGYLLKYAGKIPFFSSVKSKVDYYLAVKGVRLVQTFGLFKERCVLKTTPMVCPVCGNVHWVIVSDDYVEEFNVLPHSSEFLDIVISHKFDVDNRFFIEQLIGVENVNRLLFDGLIFESRPNYLEVVQ